MSWALRAVGLLMKYWQLMSDDILCHFVLDFLLVRRYSFVHLPIEIRVQSDLFDRYRCAQEILHKLVAQHRFAA